MSGQPENRQAAARRVARRLFGWVHDEGLTRAPSLQEVQDALLAFPGGEGNDFEALLKACEDGDPEARKQFLDVALAGPAEPVAACENHPIVNHSLLCGAPQCCEACCRAAAAEAGLPTFETPGGDAEPVAWRFVQSAEIGAGVIFVAHGEMAERWAAMEGWNEPPMRLYDASAASPATGAGEAGALREVDEQGVNLKCHSIAVEQSLNTTCDCEPQNFGRCGYCIAYSAANAMLEAVRAPGGRPPPMPPPVQPDYLDGTCETWTLVDGVPRCKKCGYSERDCMLHVDHGLCGEPDPPACAPATEKETP